MIENMMAWLLIGVALLVAEMFTGTFVLLSFGMSALLLFSLATLSHFSVISPLSVEYQLIVFMIVGTVISLVLYKKVSKNSASETTGDIDFIIKNASSAEVVELKENKKSGKVKFKVSFMGSKEWNFHSEKELEVGEEVSVIKVTGNEILIDALEEKE